VIYSNTKKNLLDKDFATTAVLYAISAFILTIYGTHVCPFLESLNSWILTLIILCAFVIALAVRTYCMYWLKWIGPCKDATLEGRIKDAWHHLFVDLSSWVFAGVLVTIWNSSMYDFPVESGAKVILGCFTLGVFSSLYLSLRVEREMMVHLAESGNIKAFPARKFLSLSARFLIFIILCFALIAVIMLLLLYKDFDYILRGMPGSETMEFGAIVKEVLFVLAVLCIGTFAVALQYSKNLKLVLHYQLRAFEGIDKGNYDVIVPVVTHDEFSKIADGTNQMILGLQEREKIKKAFGKYVSPIVAKSILESEKGTALGGRLVNVAILFIDIRSYTSISEKSTPQEVVSMLNTYFSMVVKCVGHHQGVVDKFIGDAAMAVFGLAEKGEAEESALQAAFEIIRFLPELNKTLQQNNLPIINFGIGINSGAVIAGNIGSEERLEYTVIGDAVNIASRLESLNKELHTILTVSEAIYQAASPESKSRLSFKGAHPIKGKALELAVYSL
jgi:class 3 adenylate cyclase